MSQHFGGCKGGRHGVEGGDALCTLHRESDAGGGSEEGYLILEMIKEVEIWG